ncbi:MAG: hypothetical protein AAGB93_22000 [Planctomycetota bacterium]
MESTWNQLRHLFERDDGSLPEIELTGLGGAALPDAFASIWRRGRDATAGGASYFDQGEGRDRPIASAEDAAHAAALVHRGDAESVHVVVGDLAAGGSSLPDLGVFVHPDGLTLDFRMGPAWGPPQVDALFTLLLRVAESAPDMEVRVPAAGGAFDRAWEQFRDARR